MLTLRSWLIRLLGGCTKEEMERAFSFAHQETIKAQPLAPVRLRARKILIRREDEDCMQIRLNMAYMLAEEMLKAGAIHTSVSVDPGGLPELTAEAWVWKKEKFTRLGEQEAL